MAGVASWGGFGRGAEEVDFNLTLKTLLVGVGVGAGVDVNLTFRMFLFGVGASTGTGGIDFGLGGVINASSSYLLGVLMALFERSMIKINKFYIFYNRFTNQP